MCVLLITVDGVSTPPLDNYDDTSPSPPSTLITSPADRAQHHALHILLFMILLISTTDPDNAPKSTTNSQVGHRKIHPLPLQPPPSVFACGGQALWTPVEPEVHLHMHCVVWFGISFIGEIRMDFTLLLFSRIIPYFSCTKVECISGRRCAWRSMVDGFAFYFSPNERALRKVAFTLV
jgi:hypothetical protein